MSDFVKPADQLKGRTLKDGWVVIDKYIPKSSDHVNLYSSCYIVQRGDVRGFLKAFDYSDLRKPGGDGRLKKLNYKYTSELAMLKKCQANKITTVISLLANDRLNPDDLNELVEYFILEYSGDGDMLDCLTAGSLKQFENRFQALVHIFDGLNSLHLNGIMHLDLKTENILHFVNSRITKITDFGSARQLISDVDEDLLEELNSITTTRQYAPPECLYHDFWTTDWKEYRRKVDLYLVGNVIVKLFTNVSFTAMLKKEVTEFVDWDKPENVGVGRMKQFSPHLVTAASNVYLVIKEKICLINEECGKPLEKVDIDDLVRIISQLCNPDAAQRGHPKELERNNGRDGLDRYRDKFITLRDLCVVRKRPSA